MARDLGDFSNASGNPSHRWRASDDNVVVPLSAEIRLPDTASPVTRGVLDRVKGVTDAVWELSAGREPSCTDLNDP